MAKVLLVDTNFSSGPIYSDLLARGHEVHVVGGNPADCLAKLAPNYWQLDYADTKALSALVEKEQFQYLVPGCTDRSYESCVSVGRGHFAGFDTLEVASAISHKAKFRRLATRLGLPVPKSCGDDAYMEGHPVIVKPVDAFSGKGITVLRDADTTSRDEAINRARSASPSGEYLAEEFVQGQLYSHSAFLVGRRIGRDFLVQEDGTANKFVVDTSKVLDPALHEGMLVKLRAWIELLANHLQLADGLLHTQFIFRDSQFWLIELTRRCPGDLYSQLIELSTGWPYAHHYASSFLGEKISQTRSGGLRPVMRHTITVPTEQRLESLRFLRPVRIERYTPLSLVGDCLKPSPLSRVGVLFCGEESQRALDRLYTATLHRDLYIVADGFDDHAACAR